MKQLTLDNLYTLSSLTRAVSSSGSACLHGLASAYSDPRNGSEYTDAAVQDATAAAHYGRDLLSFMNMLGLELK